MHDNQFTGIIKEISELIGIPDTLRLIKHCGGTCVYLPKKTITEDHELSVALGYVAALKIYEHFGAAGSIEIPKAQSFVVSVRNNKIKHDRKNLSRKNLALKYCLTERQITNILHQESDLNTNQLQLL